MRTETSSFLFFLMFCCLLNIWWEAKQRGRRQRGSCKTLSLTSEGTGSLQAIKFLVFQNIFATIKHFFFLQLITLLRADKEPPKYKWQSNDCIQIPWTWLNMNVSAGPWIIDNTVLHCCRNYSALNCSFQTACVFNTHASEKSLKGLRTSEYFIPPLPLFLSPPKFSRAERWLLHPKKGGYEFFRHFE